MKFVDLGAGVARSGPRRRISKDRRFVPVGETQRRARRPPYSPVPRDVSPEISASPSATLLITEKRDFQRIRRRFLERPKFLGNGGD